MLTNYLEAYDVFVKQDGRQQKAWTTKVDRTPPSATLGGSLYAGRGGFIPGGAQTLSVSARDRKPGAVDQETQAAGVKSIAYELKRNATGEVVRSGSASNATCHANNGCGVDFNRDFTVDFAGLPAGRYVVTVTTKDQLGDDPTYGSSHRNVNSFVVEIDQAAPVVTAIEHAPNRRWFGGDASVTSTVFGSDDNAGIKSFGLSFPGGPPAPTVTRNCGGLNASNNPPRCANSDSQPFAYQVTAERFPQEGPAQVVGRVTDAAGRVSAPFAAPLRVDRTGPELDLSGGLRSLNPTGRDLRVEATDGTEEAPRSGVQSLRLEIDRDGDGIFAADEEEALVEQECAADEDSCPLEMDYALPAGYPEGRHKARLTGVDRAGNESVESWSFYVVDLFPGSRSRLGLEDWWQFDSTAAGRRLAGPRQRRDREHGVALGPDR